MDEIIEFSLQAAEMYIKDCRQVSILSFEFRKVKVSADLQLIAHNAF